MRILLATIFLFSQVTFAACENDVELLKKGEVSPCTGLLYSPAADDEANRAFENAEKFKNINDLLVKKNIAMETQNEIVEKRLNLYITESQILAERLTKKENRSEWQKVLYFSLGVLATGIAVYGAKQIQ